MSETKIELVIKINGKTAKTITMPDFAQSPIYKDDAVTYISGVVSGIAYFIHLVGVKKKEDTDATK